MLGRTSGAVLVGVEARTVEVEVDLGKGLPTIAAVGLPDAAVREGIDRVRAALRHAGFDLPERRVTINLAPAELPKRGTGLDLPIAVALLVADGKIAPEDARDALFVGELGLDGRLRAGAWRGLLRAAAARESGRRRLYLPAADADEAARVPGVAVVALEKLGDLSRGARNLPARRPSPVQEASGGRPPDLADVRGQQGARRALEIAAAGGHHLLMSGPPGSGKTMLARRLPGILPPLAAEERLEVGRVWSAVGLRAPAVERPFRAPHHRVSLAGMVGGGATLRPGEISLASHGVLYLDELTEFRRDALEALRQPLEEGAISIVRLRAQALLPAAFMLVALDEPLSLRLARGRRRALSLHDVAGPEVPDEALGAAPGPLRSRRRAAAARPGRHGPGGEGRAIGGGPDPGRPRARAAAAEVRSGRPCDQRPDGARPARPARTGRPGGSPADATGGRPVWGSRRAHSTACGGSPARWPTSKGRRRCRAGIWRRRCNTEAPSSRFVDFPPGPPVSSLARGGRVPVPQVRSGTRENDGRDFRAARLAERGSADRPRALGLREDGAARRIRRGRSAQRRPGGARGGDQRDGPRQRGTAGPQRLRHAHERPTRGSRRWSGTRGTGSSATRLRIPGWVKTSCEARDGACF